MAVAGAPGAGGNAGVEAGWLTGLCGHLLVRQSWCCGAGSGEPSPCVNALPCPPPESCAAPRLTGPCRAAFPRWYYDPAAGACKQFVYGGCKGNKNNYLQEELCLRQCRGAAGEGDACPPEPLVAPRGRRRGRLPAARQGVGRGLAGWLAELWVGRHGPGDCGLRGALGRALS